MKRLSGLTSVLALSLVLLSACAAPSAPSTSSTESVEASTSSLPEEQASSSQVVIPAASSDVASSDQASSNQASSDRASSDRASSDQASSDRASSDRASSDRASSDRASSDRVSSDRASSDRASSDRASSDRASSDASSSEPVLSGPSGLVEMGVPLNYMSPAEVLALVKSKDDSKVIIDLRKPSDVQKGYIEGSIFAPMNKAVDNNNYADAIAELTSALHDATGNEIGEGKDLVLICYQGIKYAQAATDILNALGADLDHVYTMEGGMKAWDAAGYPTKTS